MPDRAPLLADTRHRTAMELPAASTERLVVFPRPWYAGWQATLDGHPLAITAYKNVAIAVAVPPNTAGRLAIAYRPAGFTLGLPIVRTSPDHGTGFDIAGQGIARADSLIKAIEMAALIAKRRGRD
jgi:hypothetical protein